MGSTLGPSVVMLALSARPATAISSLARRTPRTPGPVSGFRDFGFAGSGFGMIRLAFGPSGLPRLGSWRRRPGKGATPPPQRRLPPGGTLCPPARTATPIGAVCGALPFGVLGTAAARFQNRSKPSKTVRNRSKPTGGVLHLVHALEGLVVGGQDGAHDRVELVLGAPIEAGRVWRGNPVWAHAVQH